MLTPESKILVTGGAGMVGHALVAEIQKRGWTRILAPMRQELNLCDRDAVLAYMETHRPEFAFLLAAKVGGIGANIADPVGFLAENVRMTVNAMEACHRVGVKKILFLGSSCIYPRDASQPIKESYLLTGPLEPTNESYALSKIVGLQLARSYRVEYGTNFICPMPCNIYGTGDHFDLEKSHVLSALVRRFVDSAAAASPSVTLWGTGAARREFIHVDDVVAAILLLFDKYNGDDIINVGTGEDVSIQELAETIASEVGYRGRIAWDTSKPDGMPRKCLDITRLTQLGFVPRISLQQGIRRTVAEYRALTV